MISVEIVLWRRRESNLPVNNVVISNFKRLYINFDYIFDYILQKCVVGAIFNEDDTLVVTKLDKIARRYNNEKIPLNYFIRSS